ncbi:hypothetical protein HPP92_008354 [Vanilla planifolia]|uniref:Uncharacterized protein n=1 Tax=Vanilla planifolia TaxID=51239 RepID=A0A835R881_VANPL|nr:hypothetical protein HPP92_008354 [Vanilla planifolia]
MTQSDLTVNVFHCYTCKRLRRSPDAERQLLYRPPVLFSVVSRTSTSSKSRRKKEASRSSVINFAPNCSFLCFYSYRPLKPEFDD